MESGLYYKNTMTLNVTFRVVSELCLNKLGILNFNIYQLCLHLFAKDCNGTARLNKILFIDYRGQHMKG
jgi:hypothetical protein